MQTQRSEHEVGWRDGPPEGAYHVDLFLAEALAARGIVVIPGWSALDPEGLPGFAAPGLWISGVVEEYVDPSPPWGRMTYGGRVSVRLALREEATGPVVEEHVEDVSSPRSSGDVGLWTRIWCGCPVRSASELAQVAAARLADRLCDEGWLACTTP